MNKLVISSYLQAINDSIFWFILYVIYIGE